MIKYISQIHGEDATEELSRERARFLLEGCYIKECVDDLFENNKCFRLRIPTRDIWTEQYDENNKVPLVPIAGFYGIVGE